MASRVQITAGAGVGILGIALGYFLGHFDQARALWTALEPLRKRGMVTSTLVLVGMAVGLWLIVNAARIERAITRRREIQKSYLRLEERLIELSPPARRREHPELGDLWERLMVLRRALRIKDVHQRRRNRD